MPTLGQSRRLRYATFFYLYVMQGIPSGLALTALTNYLAAEGVDAQRLATFGTVVGLPWGIKFMWGPLIDRFQNSAMGRRRPWVLGAQVMAFLASLGLLLPADPVLNIDQLMWAFALHGIFASLQDVSVDAMAITVVPAPERGRINALMKGGMVSGQAFGAAGLALLIHYQSFQAAALVQSLVLLVFTILTFFIRERPDDAWLSVRQTPVQPNQTPSASMGRLLGKLVRALVARRSLVLFGAVALVFISERLFQRVYVLHLIPAGGLERYIGLGTKRHLRHGGGLRIGPGWGLVIGPYWLAATANGNDPGDGGFAHWLFAGACGVGRSGRGHQRSGGAPNAGASV